MGMKKSSDIEPQLANCRDYWRGWGTSERVDSDLTYYRSGFADGQLTGVLRLCSSDQPDDAVGHAVGRLAGAPWMWWVGPDSAPDTAARLTGHRAVRLGAMPVMTVPLDKVAPVDGPADLKIEAVEGIDAKHTEWPATTWRPPLRTAGVRESERPSPRRPSTREESAG
ncbi:hypothetical protein ACFWFF_37980 [Streptomyces sp. NPDC060223]|uniref:hypothetical protein n=1 Tax=unclassified Streptomyces TaxID=2593676 RepID=UPI00362C6B94